MLVNKLNKIKKDIPQTTTEVKKVQQNLDAKTGLSISF